MGQPNGQGPTSSRAFHSHLLKLKRLNDFKLKVHRINMMRVVLHAPIFLCSTHGIYNVSRDIQPWVVPPNTYIFEAQRIGDLSLSDLDLPLWQIIQGKYRYVFLYYMLGLYGKISKTETQFKSIIGNLLLYKPGDLIYERTLSIGGGGGRPHGYAGPSNRIEYGNMGFYKFMPGNSEPVYPFSHYKVDTSPSYQILPELRKKMVNHDNLELTDNSFVNMVKGRPDLVLADFAKVNKTINPESLRVPGINPEAPMIFIFSSCAAIDNTDTTEARMRWTEIARKQEEYKLEGWQMGLELGRGNYSNNSKKRQQPSVAMTRLINRAPERYLPEVAREDDYWMVDPDLHFQEIVEEEIVKSDAVAAAAAAAAAVPV